MPPVLCTLPAINKNTAKAFSKDLHSDVTGTFQFENDIISNELLYNISQYFDKVINGWLSTFKSREDKSSPFKTHCNTLYPSYD